MPPPTSFSPSPGQPSNPPALMGDGDGLPPHTSRPLPHVQHAKTSHHTPNQVREETQGSNTSYHTSSKDREEGRSSNTSYHTPNQDRLEGQSTGTSSCTNNQDRDDRRSSASGWRKMSQLDHLFCHISVMSIAWTFWKLLSCLCLQELLTIRGRDPCLLKMRRREEHEIRLSTHARIQTPQTHTFTA